LVRHAKTIEEHMAASASMLDHMRSQWLDRQVYWRMRSLSRTGSCLCLITDGMDRSKFCLPVWGRSPKGVADRIRRPCLEVSATIVHGVGVFCWVADEDMSIDAAFHVFQTRGKQWPAHLICQADNTCRESKNNHFQRLLVALASVGAFTACSETFLQVGHTHEDVDGIFGLLANALRNTADEIQTPNQICQLLHNTLEPVFAPRNDIVQIQYVSSVRPWKDLLPRRSNYLDVFQQWVPLGSVPFLNRF
jgi:hypothetical protein